MSEFNKVMDSGKRSEFFTGAVRDIQEGKGRFDLLPVHAIFRLAKHFENGSLKYGDENWKNGIYLRIYLNSALRHLFKLLGGLEDEDHAAAVMWNIGCFIETKELIEQGMLPKELNNLPKTVFKKEILNDSKKHKNDDSKRIRKRKK